MNSNTIIKIFQLRLRSLIQIIGHKLKIDDKHEKCWFHYTLHRTSMSSPLYKSEPIDNTSPRWASLEVPTLYATGHSNANGKLTNIKILITKGFFSIKLFYRNHSKAMEKNNKRRSIVRCYSVYLGHIVYWTSIHWTKVTK